MRQYAGDGEARQCDAKGFKKRLDKERLSHIRLRGM